MMVAVTAVWLGATLPAQALVLPRESLDFLQGLARDVVAAAHVPPPASEVGFALIMPGGRGGYPSFWIRDFAMSLDAGSIQADEIANHLRLVAHCQNGAQARSLAHGLIVPPFAVPDHITFAGKAAFFPGTYATGDDQGDGTFGVRPPLDDQYELVHIAHRLLRARGSTAFLDEQVDGRSLCERVLAAFDAPPVDADTGLVLTTESERAVGFGFVDGVVLTGHLLFASLLRHRAAGELAELCAARHEDARAASYRRIQQQIIAHVPSVFRERGDGWLIAATGIGRQPDVWGTLYALQLRVLQGSDAEDATSTVIAAVRAGTICHEGAVRHVPSDRDATNTSAWERTCGIALGTYQNGAYWHTPTGWLVRAVARTDPALATQIFAAYIAHLRAQDYRQGAGHDAPWECFGAAGQHAQNGVYMTSVAVPYAVLAGGEQGGVAR
ncbi:MAG: hypothetical protein U1E76_24225 [Planctomycetota bacterium]